MRILPATAVLLAAIPSQFMHAQVDRSGTMAGRSTVYAPNGVVASSQPLATGAGLAVLQRGGNAIDAAVTTAAMLNVVEPMMTGVGGDMFAIIWLADEQRMVGLNASGRAGTLMTRDEAGGSRSRKHAAVRRGDDHRAGRPRGVADAARPATAPSPLAEALRTSDRGWRNRDSPRARSLSISGKAPRRCSVGTRARARPS